MPFDPTAFKQAADSTAWNDEAPPDGDHDAELIKAEYFESQAGEDWLRLHWKVATGQLAGFEWSSVHTLEPKRRNSNEDNIGYGITARNVQALGIELAGLRDTDDLMAKLYQRRGGTYAVSVKRNAGFTNTNVKRQLAEVQTTMSGQPYGQPPPGPRPANAIMQGDGEASSPPPAQGSLAAAAADQRRDLQRDDPPTSDVPGAQPGEFEHPPQKGEIDPETGEPIPF